MQILTPWVHKAIESIREIVVNHSDADIYDALREMDLDPNDTVQKLVNEGYSFACFALLFIVLFQCYMAFDKWVFFYLNCLLPCTW